METTKEPQTVLRKTVSLETTVISDIDRVAKEENRNFNNSVETLLKWALANRKVTVESMNGAKLTA